MSTRANVRITTDGLEWKDEVQLYRHCDGYPTAVLPSLAKAFDLSGGGWEAGRAGKVAGFICAASYQAEHKAGDRTLPPYVAYEPEGSLELHGDIEWLYRLILINHEQGCFTEKPTWEVEVYRPFRKFWDEPDFKNAFLIARGEVHYLAEHADEIENGTFNQTEVGAK